MTFPSTLAANLWPDISSSATLRTIRQVVLVVAGACLITLGAKISVPFYPVPMTMQTLAVSVIAAALGLRLGLATVALYLSQGALGLPVFAGPLAGLGYMAGPTGGFLVGFLLMAAMIGAAADRGLDRHPLRIFAVLLLANLAVFVPGLLWLGTVFPSLGLVGVIEKGAMPFMLATLVKSALAAATLPVCWAIMKRLRG